MNAVGLRVRVARKTVEAVDICALELVHPDGGDLPAFSAGAHIELHLPGGWVRPYSLCNPPDERDRYLVAALKHPASRGGSAALHQAVQPGDLLHIGPPRNHFPLAAAARHSLLLAGGIGITPLLCMAEALASAGAGFALHYAGRSRARLAFVERLQRSGFAPQVHLHLDDGPAAQRLDLPALLAGAAPDTHLYVCGPQGFMDAVLDTARRLGWPAQQLHWEHFAAVSAAPPTVDTGFELQLARSGRVVPVAPGQSAAQALAEAGVPVSVSCGEGLCGACLTPVLAGVPEHRDLFLSPAEQAANGCFTPCCSRARSPRLVLDL